MDEGKTPYQKTYFIHKQVTWRARNMLKRTYALGLLAATLGCFSPLQPKQVKLRSISKLPQNAAAVGTGNTVYQDLDQGSYQNQLDYPSSGYYHPNLNPNCKSRIKMPSKMAQLLVQAIPFFKTLTKTTFRSKSALNSRLSIGFHQVLSVSNQLTSLIQPSWVR